MLCVSVRHSGSVYVCGILRDAAEDGHSCRMAECRRCNSLGDGRVTYYGTKCSPYGTHRWRAPVKRSKLSRALGGSRRG